MNPITFGSLFAGIGGIDLGFERCGMKCKWQVEINDYAQKVLAKHWPKVHRERDIRECSARNLERVDIIAGGFPCQDISYAGLGAGLNGERSGLFFEAIRLVSELQPRAVVLENVAALLTRGLDRVLGTLAEIGYDAEWHCIPAAYVGAPHIRDRVFVLAYANSQHGRASRANKAQAGAAVAIDAASKQSRPMADTRCSRVQQRGGDCQIEQTSGVVGGVFWDGTQEKPVAQKEALAHTQGNRWEQGRQDGRGSKEGACKGQECRSKVGGENVADTAGVYAQGFNNRSGQIQSWRSSWWAVEPDVGRVAHGIPARVDRLRGLGNAVVPQVAEFVGKMVLQRLESQEEQK
jgi:DNA (cytosine-5)-methyltransferase 1